MKSKDFLYKKFGASGICRFMFEYIFVPPVAIGMDNVSDEKMQELMDCTESQFRNKYPNIADDLFAIWNHEEPKMSLLVNQKALWSEFREMLKHNAIEAGGKLWD